MSNPTVKTQRVRPARCVDLSVFDDTVQRALAAFERDASYLTAMADAATVILRKRQVRTADGLEPLDPATETNPMSLLDVTRLPPDVRLTAADRIRTMRDFDLPALKFFNSSPCRDHASLEDGLAQMPPCRRCGVRLRRHQRIGVAWLWMRGRGLIADQVGTGKSAQAAGLLAAMKESGELDDGCAVVVVRPSVLPQWMDELARFLPDVHVVAATGDGRARLRAYRTGADVLVTGFQVFARDHEHYATLDVKGLIVDDVDPLRNPANVTAYAIKRLARRVDRVVVLTATPLQKQLHELHSVLEPVGGLEVFGSATAFRRRYVREELTTVWNPAAGRRIKKREILGYQNLDEFKRLAARMTLRRTPDDIDDVDLPVLSPHNVYVDLHTAQSKRYAELRAGVIKILTSEGTQVKQARAAAAFLRGAQICAGLSTLGERDGPGSSAKLDWVMQTLTGDLAEEKVVVFCQFTATVEALMTRLDAQRIDHAVIWGRQPDKIRRRQAIERFWDDPVCRVLVGTTAIEQGLNLQVARHMINIDQIMNPARMQQLAGRIRRDGSAYKTVYIHNLLARGTQEEGYMRLLAREQALADHIWDESNDLYASLPPLVLLQLIGESGI